jgi:hypothetical protein
LVQRSQQRLWLPWICRYGCWKDDLRTLAINYALKLCSAQLLYWVYRVSRSLVRGFPNRLLPIVVPG